MSGLTRLNGSFSYFVVLFTNVRTNGLCRSNLLCARVCLKIQLVFSLRSSTLPLRPLTWMCSPLVSELLVLSFAYAELPAFDRSPCVHPNLELTSVNSYPCCPFLFNVCLLGSCRWSLAPLNSISQFNLIQKRLSLIRCMLQVICNWASFFQSFYFFALLRWATSYWSN